MMIVNAFFAGGIAAGRPLAVSFDISKDALERRTLSKTSGCGCLIIRSVQASPDSDSSNPVLWLAFFSVCILQMQAYFNGASLSLLDKLCS